MKSVLFSHRFLILCCEIFLFYPFVYPGQEADRDTQQMRKKTAEMGHPNGENEGRIKPIKYKTFN